MSLIHDFANALQDVLIRVLETAWDRGWIHEPSSVWYPLTPSRLDCPIGFANDGTMVTARQVRDRAVKLADVEFDPLTISEVDEIRLVVGRLTSQRRYTCDFFHLPEHRLLGESDRDMALRHVRENGPLASNLRFDVVSQVLEIRHVLARLECDGCSRLDLSCDADYLNMQRAYCLRHRVS